MAIKQASKTHTTIEKDEYYFSYKIVISVTTADTTFFPKYKYFNDDVSLF